MTNKNLLIMHDQQKLLMMSNKDQLRITFSCTSLQLHY